MLSENDMPDNEVDADLFQSGVKTNLGHLGKPFPKGLPRLLEDKKISDEKLHQYCLYALNQCIEYGDTGFATRLLEMLGKRYQTKKRIAWWFCKFGKFGIDKAGRLVYRKRSNISKEDIGGCLERADAVPFYSERLGETKIAKLTTTPPAVAKARFFRERDIGESASVWTVSGGLPSLGKHR